MQPDYIYIVNKIYILLLITATGIICLLGIKFMRVWRFFVQEEKLRGVSVWNVRETGGQESHCLGHENVTFVEIWSFLADRLS